MQPVQVGFNPAGTHLYVTERRTDRITRYAIGASGAAGAPRWTRSAGAEPWAHGVIGMGLAFAAMSVAAAVTALPCASPTNTEK
mgnify:CR=1 FL=1